MTIFHIIVGEDCGSPDELLVGLLNPVDLVEFYKGPLGEVETEIALEKILKNLSSNRVSRVARLLNVIQSSRVVEDVVERHRHTHVVLFCLRHRQGCYYVLRKTFCRSQQRLLGPKDAKKYRDCRFKRASVVLVGVNTLRWWRAGRVAVKNAIIVVGTYLFNQPEHLHQLPDYKMRV